MNEADIDILINDVFKKLKKEHQIDLEIKSEVLGIGYMMITDSDIKTIFYDIKNLTDLITTKGFYSLFLCTPNQFIECVLVHEWSHYIDHQYNPEGFYVGQSLEQLEYNAWNIGRNLINKELIYYYDRFNEISIESYKENGIF